MLLLHVILGKHNLILLIEKGDYWGGKRKQGMVGPVAHKRIF